MYNPIGGDAYEFIELRNFSPTPVDLSGFSLIGVNFQFPTPFMIAGGATSLLASGLNPSGFAARYPGVSVQGYFTGNLSNGGERLALVDRGGYIVTSVDYDDERGWPIAPDGLGPSLQIINPFGDPDDPANWRASSQPAGSPGEPDNLSAPLPNVRLNEVAALNLGSVLNGTNMPDWVELRNAGPAPVNLAGWSLTDDGNPRKYVFPPGTSIGAGGYLVVWCDSNTNSPGLHTLFALDSGGEMAFLYDDLTNLVDAVSFGRQLADLTLARVGEGWQLGIPTPGSANQPAATAPVTNLAINEWMANPLPGGDGWLELYNRNLSLPVALRGLYLGNGQAVDQIRSHSFLAPGGFLLLTAEERPGANQLDFKLPGAGSPIILFDEAGFEIHRVTNATQSEGISRGRSPDGADLILDFPGAATPGGPNAVTNAPSVVINEFLAVNRGSVTNAAGRAPDFIEVANITATNVSLAGMGLSIDNPVAPQWLFPAGLTLPTGGLMLVWCDSGKPASTNAGSLFNMGRNVPNRSGTLYLFGSSGRLMNSVIYGPQIANLSVGRSGGVMQLLSQPTPGATNAAAAVLGSAHGLRFNEWMAAPAEGDDWFELYNTGSLPVSLAGLYLSDDPSILGLVKSKVPALSFIGPNGFVKFEASGDADKGAHHVNFRLDADGESLLLLNTNLTLIDALWLGASFPNVSEGRLVDGSPSFSRFPDTASPEFSNWLPISDIVISEILTHTDPPLEDAIELHNTGISPMNLGGWFLSDNRDSLRKFRIPDGTAIAPGGFAVFYQNQFGVGLNGFALSSVYGGQVWLSAADGAGNLTGRRAVADFGPAANGVSLGRFATTLGHEFVPLSARTFGVDTPGTLAEFRGGRGMTNAYPLVGPVVISEIMYHAPVQSGSALDLEYVEIHNYSSSPAPLYHTNNFTNTWRLQNAISFQFPTSR